MVNRQIWNHRRNSPPIFVIPIRPVSIFRPGQYLADVLRAAVLEAAVLGTGEPV